MPYSRNQPVATDDLDISQPYLYQNTNGADDSFAVDHYAFSVTDGNTGYHKKITTLPQGSVPTTTVNPILYAYQQYAAIGPLQYSKGISDAVPTPVTKLQSGSSAITLAAGATTNILNFAGISSCLFRITIGDFVQTSGSAVNGIRYADAFYDNCLIWNGSTSRFLAIQVINLNQTILAPVASSSQFAIKNTSSSTNLSNIYWTLEFLRIA